MWVYVFILSLSCFIIGLLWLLQPYRQWKKSYSKRAQQEMIIINLNGEKESFKQYMQSHQKFPQKIYLSLVVPSYNQQQRLPIMLKDTIKHLNSKKDQFSYEIIVINDGSKDKTTQVALKTAKQLEIKKFCTVQYPKNRGKGGAVKAGMSITRGEYILMVDADGATNFQEIDKFQARMEELRSKLNHPLIMLAGSRAIFSEEVKVQRKLHRRIVSFVFGFIKSVICGVKAKDTQCGFKYFTKESSKRLFEVLHIERWAFDIQLFYLSRVFNIYTEQIPVQWRDIDGSKLNVLQASINMFRDLIMIRLLYILGIWKQNDRMAIL